jgi:hypothetical protein
LLESGNRATHHKEEEGEEAAVEEDLKLEVKRISGRTRRCSSNGITGTTMVWILVRWK